MPYPTGLKIYIDGVDATYYIFGSNTFNPDANNNTFRNLNITPYLRHLDKTGPSVMRTQEGVSDLHTIEITAADGSGRVECRVEVR